MILRKLRLFFAIIAAWLVSLHLTPPPHMASELLFDDTNDSYRRQSRLCLR